MLSLHGDTLWFRKVLCSSRGDTLWLRPVKPYFSQSASSRGDTVTEAWHTLLFVSSQLTLATYCDWGVLYLTFPRSYAQLTWRHTVTEACYTLPSPGLMLSSHGDTLTEACYTLPFPRSYAQLTWRHIDWGVLYLTFPQVLCSAHMTTHPGRGRRAVCFQSSQDTAFLLRLITHFCRLSSHGDTLWLRLVTNDFLKVSDHMAILRDWGRQNLFPIVPVYVVNRCYSGVIHIRSLFFVSSQLAQQDIVTEPNQLYLFCRPSSQGSTLWLTLVRIYSPHRLSSQDDTVWLGLMTLWFPFKSSLRKYGAQGEGGGGGGGWQVLGTTSFTSLSDHVATHSDNSL